jgi:hypothetical protein
MLIESRQPFDFARTLRFILSPPALLNGREFAPLLDYFVEGEYRRVADVDGQPLLYGMSKSRRGRSRALRIRILAGPTDAAAERAVSTLIERQFSTRLDLAPFYRLAGRDRVLSRLVRHFDGMRIPQAPTVY